MQGGIAAALALSLAACGAETTTDAAGNVTEDRSGDDMAQVFGDIDGLSMTANALESTGLDGVLEGAASYTVFAPTDDAIGALGADADAALNDESRSAIVAAVLREHMVPGAVTLDAIRKAITDNGGRVTLSTFGNGDLTLTQSGDVITIANGEGQTATLSGDSTVTGNGVVIPIDGVLANPQAFAGSEPAAAQ